MAVFALPIIRTNHSPEKMTRYTENTSCRTTEYTPCFFDERAGSVTPVAPEQAHVLVP